VPRAGSRQGGTAQRELRNIRAPANGGITWKLPKEYPAPLEASTNTDSIRGSLPVPILGFVRKELITSSGKGGASVKVVTVNGGIAVNQGRDQFASHSDSPVEPAIAEEAPQR